MARPGVNVAIMNGQLGIQGPSENGVTVLVLATPAAPTAGYGVAFTCLTKQDVTAAFADVLNAAVVTALNDGFFGEAPEGTALHIVAMAQATSLDTLAALANVEKGLIKAAGKARLVGVVKFPAGGYTPTVTEGFDTDVHAAVPILQTIANTYMGNKKPFRFFVQGYACTGVAAAAKDYAVGTNRNGHIVVGELNASTANATLTVMGRAAKAEPQQNIGKVKSGSLNIPTTWALTIGATAIASVTAATLNTFHDKRYITLEQNEIASGFIVTNDNSLVAVTDDYNNLRHGRIIDNAVRVAYSTYYAELKDDVFVDENGRLSKVAEKALETAIESAIDKQMPNQLNKTNKGFSDVKVAINPDYSANIALYNQNGIMAAPSFNLLQTGTTYIFLKLKPKGCLQYINVYVGFTAS
ncbi:MAG: hypothetical protein IPP48_03390 [Chitinophagaceae bacterium]|nr:hypothetical protein [Chitinophagaceae bacterium]